MKQEVQSSENSCRLTHVLLEDGCPTVPASYVVSVLLAGGSGGAREASSSRGFSIDSRFAAPASLMIAFARTTLTMCPPRSPAPSSLLMRESKYSASASILLHVSIFIWWAYIS